MNLVFVTMSSVILCSPCGAMLKDSDISEPRKSIPKKEQQLSTAGGKPNPNKGWTQIHPALLALWGITPPHTKKEEDEKKESPLTKWDSTPGKNSTEEPTNNRFMQIHISSEEDFIESGEEEPQQRPFKRLKKKKHYHENSSTETTPSNNDSEDSITERTDSISSRDSEDSTADEPSIDEDYKPSRKSRKSHSKKHKKKSSKDQPSYKVVSTRSSTINSKEKNLNLHSFAASMESEEEDDDLSGRILPYSENDKDFDLVTTMGTRLKLLANVYLANLQGKANIFLPRYSLEVETEDGSLQTIQSFFETPKGEICVFASGGLHHIWEKNIGHIYKLFFGQKVKIIRSHWMQKHLQKDKEIKRDLEEEFKGKENELHSEFYYDLFFRHFFVQELAEFVAEGGITLKRLTIHGFSWWDVCNGCEDLLSSHKPPIETGLELSYKIAARKRYNHFYPETSLVEGYTLSATVEEEAWNAIWEALAQYTGKSFENHKEKENFWTKTKDGLEVCKWLGQAFRERTKGLDGTIQVTKKGDVLAFYKSMQPKKTKALEKLLVYLQDKNWDLSCWYWGPNFPSPYQPAWKRHGKHLIRPHFGWESVTEFKIEDKNRSDHCEMCGNENLMNVHLVFHPKHQVSNKFLNLSEEDQKLTEKEYGFTFNSLVSNFPDPLKQKRRQCLYVGSECIKYLCQSKKDIKKWHKKHPEAEANAEWEAVRLAAYAKLDEIENNLAESEKKETKKRKRKK